ncbi:DUF563 domain-containing protein [Teratosphaeria destructans]|uniref:EGF domain-specific O-linked N-acetylglucosamine transferase n=1 Tax=Teratosphaeria destructans TaxID=418781 RepID=A0A9W7SX78_9PEZI|nr:DUF563 domain-containing protein [Teratosphaeria destructans]
MELPRMCNLRFGLILAVFFSIVVYFLPHSNHGRIQSNLRQFAQCASDKIHDVEGTTGEQDGKVYEHEHSQPHEPIAVPTTLTATVTVTVASTVAAPSSIATTTAFSDLPVEVLDVVDSPEYCSTRFGSGLLRALSERPVDYCDDGSSANLTCFSYHLHEDRIKDSFCFGGPAFLDPIERIVRMDCGLKYYDEESGDKTMPPLDAFPEYGWMETGPRVLFERFIRTERDPRFEAVVKPKGFSFLVKREDNGFNMWHTMMQIMSLTLSLDVMRQTVDPNTGDPYFTEAEHERSRVVILDDLEDGPYLETWGLLSRLPIVRLRDIDVSAETEPTKIVVPLPGVANPFWQGDWQEVNCGESVLLHTFKRRVLDLHRIAAPPPRNGNNLTLTMIDRHNRRRLLNKDQYFAKLQQRYPDITMQFVDFASLTFAEQLQIAHSTDILVGVHGAGLTHGMFLPPDSRIIEILPAYFWHQGFKNMAGFLGHKYFKRYADDVRGLGKVGDWQVEDVVVGEEEFLEVVREAVESLGWRS